MYPNYYYQPLYHNYCPCCGRANTSPIYPQYQSPLFQYSQFAQGVAQAGDPVVQTSSENDVK